MGGKDSNYEVVYRGGKLQSYKSGGWVFFQRSKQSGGGYWFGRTYDDCFIFELEMPVSLAQGLKYLITLGSDQTRANNCEDDFQLTYSDG